MFVDFMGVCFDQIFNQAAKFRYMFGGKATTPLVIRTMIGAGRSAAAQHSQSPYGIFTAVPGLKCVVPSRAMRTSRSISHDKYSFMAALGSPGRS